MFNRRSAYKVNFVSDLHGKKSKTKEQKKEPYLCVSCNRVWQYTENYISTDYIPDFPKMGCYKHTCRGCR